MTPRTEFLWAPDASAPLAQVSVIGLPDARWGEIVAAVVASDPTDPPARSREGARHG